jgi:hypothetical protein
MPPYPFEYEGKEAIIRFLEYRVRMRGAPLRLVPTRAADTSISARFGLPRPLPRG